MKPRESEKKKIAVFCPFFSFFYKKYGDLFPMGNNL
jgi:hypothetical protein